MSRALVRRNALLALTLLAACLMALALPACGGGREGNAPPASPQAPEMVLQTAPQVVADQGVLREVTAAYQQFWQTYAIALGTLDEGPLNTVAAQGALQSVQDYLQGLKNEGKAYLVTSMRHAPLVTSLGRDEAQVEGTGALTLRPVKAGADQSSGEEREEQIRYVLRFQRLEGTWKATAFSWLPLEEGGGQG